MFAAISALPASAADGESSSPPIKPQAQANGGSSSFTKEPSKFSGAIQSVVDAAQAIEPGAGFANSVAGDYDGASVWFTAGLLRETKAGMLQVYIHVDGQINDGLRTALEALGADLEMESAEQGIVQASVPYGILHALANVSGVAQVTEPSYGVVNVGANLTEGDTRMNFDDLRAIQGVDGTDVTVGVISDGIAGLQTAVASGDLPATSETRGSVLTATADGVIAQSFRADGDLEAGFGGGPGAEGTAMLEIVHDIAPGAQLRFANFDTSLEFMAAINFLASVSDVVVDDIGWFGRQTDGTSDVSTNTASALTNVANPIRAYATAVGNGATRHYEGMFTAGPEGLPTTGFPGAVHSFVPASPTTDALGLGTQAYNSVRLTNGQSVVVWLVWEDTEGAPTADYDLLFQDPATGFIVGGSIGVNALSGSPVEVAGITYSGAGISDLRIIVQNYNNESTARDFELTIFPGTTALPNGTYLNYNTREGSVGAQSDAGGGVISVGAANNSSSTTIAPYSSQGPTGDGRMKPDITGIDGVDVSGSGGFPSTFFGTSAAAPHIAGLAALLLDFRPDLKAGDAGDDPMADRSALRGAILNGGVDLGDAGPDNVYGYGRADGAASAAELFAAPVFDAPGGLALVEGATRTADGLSFTDLNLADAHTIAVDWGDGTSSSGPATDAQTNGIDGQPPSAVPAVYDPTVFDVQSTGTIYTVNTTDDVNDGTCDGTHCSLREAITAANGNNATTTIDAIHFSIAGTGPHTIWISGSALPAITGGLVIDGYTQPGSSPNTNTPSQGLNSVIQIAVRPTISGIIGFNVQSSSTSVVRGLAIQRFDKAISLTSGGPHVVEGNLLGSTADGTAGLGNNFGVWVQVGAPNATIGGSSAASANLIAASELDGLFIDRASGTTIQNNLIGTDSANSIALPSLRLGVYLWEGSEAVVTRNTIAFNLDHGVQVETWTTANISGNTITSNVRDGIFVAEGSTNINIAANTVAGNDTGIRIGDAATDAVSILGNSISGHVRLGIDLQPATPVETEPNDSLDTDSGFNRMMNFPIITSSTSTAVGGTINTEATSVVRIELFANSACHSSGFGEGLTFVGVATVTTDTGGNAAFSIPFAAPGGAILTSTATLALSTSHFSACWVAPVAPSYSDNGVFTAQATVTDDDGLSDAVSFTVTVANAVPVADAGAPLVVFEGAPLTHDASFTDPGTADTHTALVDWGDATVATATVDQGPRTTSATRTFADEGGPFTLTLTVTDDDGGVGVDATTITVLNATPVLDMSADMLINASNVLDVQLATFSDGGVLDTHTATVDWGDGTAVDVGTVNQGAGTVDGSHIYDVKGTYTVTVTVTDDDGGVGSATLQIEVVEDVPVVDAGVDLSVEEGSSLLLSFSFVDAASETHDATVIWGDGATTTATVNQSLDTVAATHTYDDQGVFIAQASVTDDTGKSGLDSVSVTVTNAIPVVVAGANLVVSVSTVSDEVLATFTDAGVLDTHTATIDWGDGTALATGTVDAGSVRGSHVYGFYGLYTVTITVADDDGGSASTTVSAQVYNIPAVPSITAWGMALSVALLAMVYWWAMRQRRLTQARRE